MSRSLPIFLATLVAVLVTAACSTKVTFPTGVKYPVSQRIEESAVISLPDEIKEREIKIKVGKLWERFTYKIKVMDAYKTEAGARVRSLFNGSVALTTNSVLDELTPEIVAKSDDAEGQEVSSSELDRLLSEIDGAKESEAPEEESKGWFGRKGDDNQWMEDQLYEASKDELIASKPAYHIRFEQALLGFPNSQAVVSFIVVVVDTRTGNAILTKRYQGRSSVFKPYRNQKTNEDIILRLIKEAFSGPMNELSKDILERAGR